MIEHFATDSVEHIQPPNRFQLAAQIAQHERHQVLTFGGLPLGEPPRVDRGERQRAKGDAEQHCSCGNRRHQARATPGIALDQKIEPHAQQSRRQFQTRETPPIASGAQICGERLLPGRQRLAQCLRQAFQQRQIRLRLPDKDAQNAVRRMRRQKMRQFRIDPARRKRGGRTQQNQIGRAIERASDRIAKIRAGREFGLIAKDRTQPRRLARICAQAARRPISFQRAMQPLRPVTITMAVTDKRYIVRKLCHVLAPRLANAECLGH
ncbi:hypothetical protein D9M73_114740 [compost metagenome]